MSFIYYLCVAENQKILHESGNITKYGKYARLIIPRCMAMQKRCFEAEVEEGFMVSFVSDLTTSWIVITDTEVNTRVTFSLLSGLQKTWRSLNRPLQFNNVLEQRANAYASTDEEKVQFVLQEIQEFGEISNSVKIEPLSNLLKRGEVLQELLERVDEQRIFTPELIASKWWQNPQLWIIAFSLLAIIIIAFIFVGCGLKMERCYTEDPKK